MNALIDIEAALGTHCPACGYDLGVPAWKGNSASHEICACCFIHCGCDDGVADITARLALQRDWRMLWIARGMAWRSGKGAPVNWNPTLQVVHLLNRLTEAALGLAPQQRKGDDFFAPFPADMFQRVRTHHIRPGLAWLRNAARWYLIEQHLGDVREDDIVQAMWAIDCIETKVAAEAARLPDAPPFRLLVRKVRVPGFEIPCTVDVDLLLDTGCTAHAATQFEHDVRHLFSAAEAATGWTHPIAMNLLTQRTLSPTIASEQRSLWGDHWFQRFLPDGYPTVSSL